MITGSIVAIVTPMNEDGSLDFDSLRKLIDFHVDQQTDAIVIVGTSGESPTVNVDEHCELIRGAVSHAAGRIPVIAGVGGNSTAEAVELTRFAKQAGAEAGLSVVPYYNKPTQEGLYQHFKAIAEADDLPILLYNVPGRTVADLANDTALIDIYNLKKDLKDSEETLRLAIRRGKSLLQNEPPEDGQAKRDLEEAVGDCMMNLGLLLIEQPKAWDDAKRFLTESMNYYPKQRRASRFHLNRLERLMEEAKKKESGDGGGGR